MPVLPELQQMLDRIAAARAQQAGPAPVTVAERRALVHAQMGMRTRLMEPAPKVDQADHRVPVDGGELTVRVYTPPGAARPLPVHLYVHGGGWWLC